MKAHIDDEHCALKIEAENITEQFAINTFFHKYFDFRMNEYHLGKISLYSISIDNKKISSIKLRIDRKHYKDHDDPCANKIKDD